MHDSHMQAAEPGQEATDRQFATLPEGLQKDVLGYCDPWSVRAGEAVHFKISRYAEGEVRADIVRLISGDDRPHGTGLIEEQVMADVAAGLVVPYQPLVPGSYAHVKDMPAVDAGSLSCWCMPTLLPDGAEQTLIRYGELTLSVSSAGFAARWADSQIFLADPVCIGRWYHVTLELGQHTTLSIQRQAAGVAERQHSAKVSAAAHARLPAGDLYLAASGPGQAHFNGRLEAPVISGLNGQGQAEDVACWDFAVDIQSQQIIDTSPQALHGRLYQNPTRGVRGVCWDGSVQSYLQQPDHYAAIHFHADDLTDAQWQDTLVWQVPDDLASGQYALKLVMNEDTATPSDDYIPFFVRPAATARRAKLAYLVPTATYLAYANQRLGLTPGPFGSGRIRYANDAFLRAHPELGYSMYEYHADHSGVHYSSRLRPVLNMKPKNNPWAFNADTHITAWLHARGQRFDVLTDEDLHLEGAAALQGYRTVITGTHPEYYSTAMRAGLADWLGEGGRLMYMGGNGFYWRVAFQADNPAIMEVRRAEDGTRAWIAQPGEYYHQFGGEYGGLWRRLGKPPNELVGVGFAAQGFDGGTYYRPAAGALDKRVEFLLQGVSNAQVWGNYGNQGGGAAGEEVDRWDPALGSPAHAVVIASSEAHKPGMLRVKEEFHMMEPLGEDPEIRADMVFFEVPGGGAVFSTGSISYAGSLAHNNYDNDIAQLTGNVLQRFLDAAPFVYPGDQPGNDHSS